MVKRNDSSDPERNVAVNTATDPQRPGSTSVKPRVKDSHPPGTSAAETTVPTDTATATREPGPEMRAPAQAGAGVRRTPRFDEDPGDRGGDTGRGGVE